MKYRLYVLLVFYIFSVNQAVLANDNYLSSKKTNIQILGENSGYLENVVVRGTHSTDEDQLTIVVPYTELESVNEIQASYMLLGKSKEIKKKQIIDHALVSSSFYSGIRSKTIIFPDASATFSYKYQYQKKCEETMFMAHLPLNDTDHIDTLSYHITVPDHLTIKYELVGDTSSIEQLHIIDELANNNTLSIITHPKHKFG